MTEYSNTISEQLERYETNPDTGLSSAQVEEQRAHPGGNPTPEKKGLSAEVRALLKIKYMMALILIVAASISVVAGNGAGGGMVALIAMSALAVAGTAVEVAWEIKVRRELSALNGQAEQQSATVLRDGETGEYPASEVVPGDIILLKKGDVVPADGRLLDCDGLRCDQWTVTGEHLSAEKDSSAVLPEDTPPEGRINMVYRGCVVTDGTGRAVVTGTGRNTLEATSENARGKAAWTDTPAQKQLARTALCLGLALIAVGAALYVLCLSRGESPVVALIAAAALVASASAEGISALAASVTALSVRAMAGKGAVIRQARVLEPLAGVSVACVEKSAIFGASAMSVRGVWTSGSKTAREPDSNLSERGQHLLRLGALCAGDQVGAPGREDPAGAAIVEQARVHGMDKTELEEEFPRVLRLNFAGSEKLQGAIHQVADKLVVIVMGDIDSIIHRCGGVDEERVRSVGAVLNRDCKRICAIACREIDQAPEAPDGDEQASGLALMGMLGIAEQPLAEVAGTASPYRQSGIRVVLLSEEDTDVAEAAARKLEILPGDGEIADWSAISGMTDGLLSWNIGKYGAFANTDPQCGLRVVSAWQAQEREVAAIVSERRDVAAVRVSEVGCAVDGDGNTGALKSAAGVVLTGDVLPAFLEAVRQSRAALVGIWRSARYTIGCGLGMVLPALTASALGWGLPMPAFQMLLAGTVSGVASVALSMEPARDDEILSPILPGERESFAGRMWISAVLQGIKLSLLTLCGFWLGMSVPLSGQLEPSYPAGMTVAFIVFCLSGLIQAVNCLSEKSVFSAAPHQGGKLLPVVLSACLVIVMLVVIIPQLREQLGFCGLSIMHWAVAIGISAMSLAFSELAKAALRLRERIV